MLKIAKNIHATCQFENHSKKKLKIQQKGKLLYFVCNGTFYNAKTTEKTVNSAPMWFYMQIRKASLLYLNCPEPHNQWHKYFICFFPSLCFTFTIFSYSRYVCWNDVIYHSKVHSNSRIQYCINVCAVHIIEKYIACNISELNVFHGCHLCCNLHRIYV